MRSGTDKAETIVPLYSKRSLKKLARSRYKKTGSRNSGIHLELGSRKEKLKEVAIKKLAGFSGFRVVLRSGYKKLTAWPSGRSQFF